MLRNCTYLLIYIYSSTYNLNSQAINSYTASGSTYTQGSPIRIQVQGQGQGVSTTNF